MRLKLMGAFQHLIHLHVLAERAFLMIGENSALVTAKSMAPVELLLGMADFNFRVEAAGHEPAETA
jgi:hypothetical protein